MKIESTRIVIIPNKNNDKQREVIEPHKYSCANTSQILNLLAYYKKLSYEQSKIKSIVHFGNLLPKELESRIKNYYNPETGELYDLDKIVEIIEAYEKEFLSAKEKFLSEYTEPKLAKLIGREYGTSDENVDIEFLSQHTEKLGSEKLETLKRIVDERNRLSRKIFKTRHIKERIDSLNQEIKHSQSLCYMKIAGWYESQDKEILGIKYGLQLYNLSILHQNILSAMQDVENMKRIVVKIKKLVSQVKIDRDKKNSRYEALKSEAIKQIISLGGLKYVELLISHKSDSDTFEGHDIYKKVYASKFLNYKNNYHNTNA